MAFAVGTRTLDIVATRFADSSDWADTTHASALASPPELDLAVRESEVVDAQRTVLVADPQLDPRTWKPIVEPLRTQSYVVAPIVVAGKTVATLHADRWFSDQSMTTTDEQIVGLVAGEVSWRLNNQVSRRRELLTPQQIQVMELLAQGHSNAAIARALFVSPETVKSHLHNIYDRLSVANRAEAVGQFFDLDRNA